jgi:hypothetical protein
LAAVQNRIQAIDELTIVTAVKLINSLNDTGETIGALLIEPIDGVLRRLGRTDHSD